MLQWQFLGSILAGGPLCSILMQGYAIVGIVFAGCAMLYIPCIMIGSCFWVLGVPHIYGPFCTLKLSRR
jgi:hypothetical protein